MECKAEKEDSFCINLSSLFTEDDKNTKLEKFSPNPQVDQLCIDYVESSLNYQGNYQNYVFKTLQSIIPLKDVNYSNLIEQRRVLLPEQNTKKTLILDLDETLIHSDFEGYYKNYDSIINFSYNNEDIFVPIFIRPGLFEFLHNISQIFEIIVFTASIKEYADAILNFLDPENKYFKLRFYRHHCLIVKDKLFIKDLRIFQNRNQESIIIVDNSIYSFCNQISNGVLINSFYNDKEDRELFNLFSYLKNYIQNINDVRTVNEQVFNFSLIMNELTLCTYA